MANAFRQQIKNQGNSGAAGPETTQEEYPSRRFNQIGDEMVGVVIAQSGWLPGTNGTYRIYSMQKGEEKFSFFLGTDGQKDALADAIDAIGVNDTAPGDQFRLKWTETRKTASGFNFRKFEAKVKRSE